MGWDRLFEDMSAQMRAAEAADLEADIAEVARGEAARTAASDRWRARLGGRLRLLLRDGRHMSGSVLDAAPGWLLLGEGERRALIPAHAVVLRAPLGSSAPPAGIVEQRLTLGHVLRGLAADGLTVVIHTLEGGSWTGRIVRVGADHCDLRTIGPREPETLTVLWAAMTSVESR